MMRLGRLLQLLLTGIPCLWARGDGGVAYTNHAGHAVRGVPVALTQRDAHLSNAGDVVRYPLSIFPEMECRRLAADYLLAHPSADPDLLRVPTDVKRAMEGPRRALTRVRKRAARGLCSEDDARALTAETRAALKDFLAQAEADGRITAAERKVLER